MDNDIVKKDNDIEKKNNGVEKKKNNIDKKALTIPNINLNQCEGLADDITLWAKFDKAAAGIVIESQGKTLPNLRGRLVFIEPYLGKWTDGVLEKLPHVENKNEIPKGFERRCDIKIDSGGTLVGLSLAKSSFEFQLCPYLKHLKNQGLRPEEVTTRIRTRMASNSQGKWPIAVFDIVEGESDNVTPQQPPEDNTPNEWR
jgi:hypothetical protein